MDLGMLFLLLSKFCFFVCKQWAADRVENIWTHRECRFRSIYTKQLASKPETPWKDCLTPRDYLGKNNTLKIIVFFFSFF